MKAIRIFGRNIRDAFKSVFRNFSLSFASISCITITLLVVAIAVILSYNVNNFTKLVEQDVTIVTFMDKDTTKEKAEEYVEKVKHLDGVETVEYQMIPEGTTSLEMFKRGELDDATVEAEEYLSMKGTEWEGKLIPTERSLSTNYLWLDFSGANPEFNTFVQSENFRKALQYSLNREAIASLRDPVDPQRVLRATINAEGAIYDGNGVDYTDYAPLKAVKDNTDVNKGSLTAAQIVKACKTAGITPVAAITTLYDRKTPYLFDNAGYIISDGNWSWEG